MKPRTPARVMLLTNSLQAAPAGGRELLCKLNRDILRDIYGDRLVLFVLPSYKLRGIKAVLSALKGHIDGLNKKTIASALQVARSESVSKVFIDGSNLGELVKIIKKQLPQVEVSTFFHNVEARFFWGAFRQKASLRSLGVLIANFLAEKKSVRYSDKIICLSERDSRRLDEIYGRPATHLSPMALEDKMPADFGLDTKPVSEKFALFVGGNFYANRAGITWFVKNVVPRIQIKTCIVGRGLEDIRKDLEVAGKVEVIGAVDDLASWYQNAHFV
ncbi:MAG: glycosyltransferase, partial [Candidatus Saccharimonadales bacterium]